MFSDTEQLQQDILAWGNNQSVEIHARGFVNGVRDLKGLVTVKTAIKLLFDLAQHATPLMNLNKELPCSNS